MNAELSSEWRVDHTGVCGGEGVGGGDFRRGTRGPTADITPSDVCAQTPLCPLSPGTMIVKRTDTQTRSPCFHPNR